MTIHVDELKIGMNVVLPLSWFKHPFLTNEFVIREQEQIDRIVDYGIREIVIDFAKGLSPERAPADETGPFAEPPEPVPAKSWPPEKLIPEELHEAIRNKKLPPARRARIVHRSAVVLMERLFDDPKAENIRVAKTGVADVVDMIVGDDGTASELLRITSYDYSTYTHSVNVGVLSVLLSKLLLRRSDAHDLHELGAGFFLHDIGKVRIDPAIINKPGRLTDEEMEQVRTHPDHGYRILSETNQLTEECRVIVMQHHEREDGSGYPRQVRGDEIHDYGRICCITDIYDALTAERPYKERLTTFEALKLMKEKMANHFQKELFENFVLLFAGQPGGR